MTQGSLTSFVTDRFGNANSALALNGGWTQVPSGVYFDSSEFTISVWVYPQQIGFWARIIDFGNGLGMDNIVISLATIYTPKYSLHFFKNSSIILAVESSQNLTLNEWQFLAVTFNGTNERLYLNGVLTYESNQDYNLPTLSRNSCYIGKSNWPTDGFSSSYLDDLRFYNKSLNSNEILELFNHNQSSKINFLKLFQTDPF